MKALQFQVQKVQTEKEELMIRERLQKRSYEDQLEEQRLKLNAVQSAKYELENHI